MGGIVKLRRIYPFCGRNPPAPKREINALEVAEQSLNRVKQLNLTIPSTIIAFAPAGMFSTRSAGVAPLP